MYCVQIVTVYKQGKRNLHVGTTMLSLPREKGLVRWRHQGSDFEACDFERVHTELQFLLHLCKPLNTHSDHIYVSEGGCGLSDIWS